MIICYLFSNEYYFYLYLFIAFKIIIICYLIFSNKYSFFQHLIIHSYFMYIISLKNINIIIS